MNYQGGFFMSKQEQLKYAVIEEFRSGRLRRKEAAMKLSLSERQISRLARKVRQKSLEGIKHGNYGRPPANKKSEVLLNQYVELYRRLYSNFNFSHALEMIDLHHDLEKISYKRFRRACRKAGLGKVKRRRVSRARMARERSAEEGFMLQLDGSPHRWNGSEMWSLISFIDDASSDVPAAKFFDSETTWACMNLLREVISKKGIPHFILTDKAGWSSGTFKRQNFSQFERACRELGICVITSSSAETKGRVERLNRTFQDRLIPELELYGIKSQKDANRYLEQCFIPSWREKFSVEARSDFSRYQALDPHIDLSEVFCMKFKRIANRDHTMEFKGTRYKLEPANFGSLAGRELQIHEYENGTFNIFYGRTRINYIPFPRPHIKQARFAN